MTILMWIGVDETKECENCKVHTVICFIPASFATVSKKKCYGSSDMFLKVCRLFMSDDSVLTQICSCLTNINILAVTKWYSSSIISLMTVFLPFEIYFALCNFVLWKNRKNLNITLCWSKTFVIPTLILYYYYILYVYKCFFLLCTTKSNVYANCNMT